MLQSLQFTGKSQKLLLVDVIERCCRKSVIHEVAGIGRCMKVFNDKGEFTVSRTQNISIQIAHLTRLPPLSASSSPKDPISPPCGRSPLITSISIVLIPTTSGLFIRRTVSKLRERPSFENCQESSERMVSLSITDI